MVYIIHFQKPFHHAQHYIGSSRDVAQRFQRHLRGDGSRLLRAVKKANIHFDIVRVMEGNHEEEMRLKRWHNTRRLCPICMKSRMR